MILPEHVAWLNDGAVVKYSEQRHKLHTHRSQEAYLNGFIDNKHDHVWLISIKNSDIEIGTITALVDEPNNVAQMGILLGNRDMWGKGYGTEAWKTVMDWLFEEMDVRKIECGTMSANRAMRRVAVNNRMEVQAAVTQHFLLDGQPEALLLYGRDKPRVR
jgi:RimJ/RimL family protein N-acetyltransferase